MIQAAEIKKGKGIDELLSGYGEQAEAQSRIQVVGGVDFTRLYAVFEELLGLPEQQEFERRWAILDESVPDALQPDEISAFHQSLVAYESHQKYAPVMSSFVSHLMQNSYAAGNNGFTLKESNLTPQFLQGKRGKPLRITIDGDVMHDHCIGYAEITINGNAGCLGNETRNTTYLVKRDAGEVFGQSLTNCRAEIDGDASRRCGANAEKSRFIIKGSADAGLGEYAKDSSYTVHGYAEFAGQRAKHSIFRATRPDTLTNLMKHVADGNRITFIHPNGKERIVRDYDDKR